MRAHEQGAEGASTHSGVFGEVFWRQQMTNEELGAKLSEVEKELATQKGITAVLVEANSVLRKREMSRRKIYFIEFKAVVKQCTDEDGKVDWHLVDRFLREHGLFTMIPDRRP
jgi:hypothetical protein